MVRTYHILGYLAALHSLILSSWLLLSVFGLANWEGPAEARLWVGLATLWLLWPVILALHPGRTLKQFVVVSLAALALVAPAYREYRAVAPAVLFGFPVGVYLSPSSIGSYWKGYRSGQRRARMDIASGRLEIETYGLPLPGAPEYWDTLKQRYDIDVRAIATDINTDEQVMGHAKGYNDVTKLEIERRFGKDVFKGGEKYGLK